MLLDCNLVVKHQFGKNIAQFERAYQCSQHDHLIDIESGKVIEFCDPRINEIIKTACELYNFTPVYHSLYIYGNLGQEKKENNNIKKGHADACLFLLSSCCAYSEQSESIAKRNANVNTNAGSVFESIIVPSVPVMIPFS